MEDHESLDHSGFHGGGAECLDGGYVLKVKPTGFADKLDAGKQSTKAVKHVSKLLILSR